MNAIMVTGASAGIGEEFARQLAAEKYNLVLVARRLDRLEALAESLRSTYAVEVACIAADLADGAASEVILSALKARDITVTGLVNNAGFGDRGAVQALSLDRQLNMIQVNVTALFELTWRLLPTIKHAQDGFIINVASTAGFFAGPNMAVYYATKAFVLSFTEALHEELKSEGVAVSALCPGATASEFAQEANMTETLLFKSGLMTSQAVVADALAKRHKAIVVPGIKNRLLVWSGKFSPRGITRKLTGMLQA